MGKAWGRLKLAQLNFRYSLQQAERLQTSQSAKRIQRVMEWWLMYALQQVKPCCAALGFKTGSEHERSA